MKISFSTAALFPRDTIQSLKLIEHAGFKYAELMPQCRRETTPTFAKSIIKETNVRIGSIHFPLVFFSMFYNPYPGMMREVKDMIDDLTYSAEIMDSDVIVIHPPYFNDDTTKSIFERAVLNNMRYLCKKGMEHGVKIALENSPKGGRTVEEMVELIRILNCENIFPMVDTTEAVESNQDPLEMIRKLNVIHLHVSDHRENEKHLPPGEGTLDWENIIIELKRKDYSGFITIEPSYRYYLHDALSQLRKSLSFLNGILR